MSDRYNALTVVLDRDIRTDDAKALISAIRMIKGVLTVTPIVVDSTAVVAYDRARRELIDKLYEVLK
jgi:hypothetical protein